MTEICPIFREDEQGIIHITGELTIHGLERLRLFLTDILRSNKDPVLSLAEVTFMDTAAMQLLVAFRKSLPADRPWRVVAVSDQVERILTLSGLKKVLLAQED